MTRMLGLAPWFGALATAALLATGCAGAPPPVDLGGGWPAHGGDYGEETERWTRVDDDRSGMTMVVEVAAIFKAPAWRAAYVDFRASREGLSSAGRSTLAAAEKAAGKAAHEIELLVTTYDRRANDLGKGARSIWHLTLVGEDGHEVAPIEIVRDRRPRSEIKAYFPRLGDFAQPYIARFPAGVDLFGPGARHIVLRMASGQGRVELVWRGR